jgi:hypothetical protein
MKKMILSTAFLLSSAAFAQVSPNQVCQKITTYNVMSMRSKPLPRAWMQSSRKVKFPCMRLFAGHSGKKSIAKALSSNRVLIGERATVAPAPPTAWTDKVRIEATLIGNSKTPSRESLFGIFNFPERRSRTVQHDSCCPLAPTGSY